MDEPERLVLRNRQALGDIAVLTMAVESLHLTYPGKYLTALEVSRPAIFDHNPRVAAFTPEERATAKVLELEYGKSINRSNQEPIHFGEGWCRSLADRLGAPLTLKVCRPYLYLSDQERRWTSQVAEIVGSNIKYWVLNAGSKSDVPIKAWPHEFFQAVIDDFQGRIQFVQVGKHDDLHKPLRGVINLLGQTDDRQLIRLCHHAQAGLGGITGIHHLLAAFQKPYVCIAGGRESVAWEQYHTATMLHTIGKLPCCRTGGCWKSHVLPGRGIEAGTVCTMPIVTVDEPRPKCMQMISPEETIRAVEALYTGGVLSY